MIVRYLIPNEHPNPRWATLGWSIIGLLAWQMLRPTVFPGPLDIVMAFSSLWSDGVFDELFNSLSVNLEALCLSALIGLPLSYTCRVPAIHPIASFVGKLRFVGSAVFYLPLLLIVPSQHWVKVWLLTLGEMFYLVTSMSGVVGQIQEFRFDDARTLRMSERKSVWYVVVRGTVAEAIDSIRDNAAIGWSLLMFVEGVVRSEGGVGVVIINAEKHTNYDQFFAVVVLVVLVGIGQDWLIGQFRKVAAPYA